MSHIVYEFEELEVLENIHLLAAGKAEISYEVEPGDAYSGYLGGISFSVESIELFSTTKDKPNLALTEGSFLFDEIETALRHSPHEYRIVEACAEDANSDFNDY